MADALDAGPEITLSAGTRGHVRVTVAGGICGERRAREPGGRRQQLDIGVEPEWPENATDTEWSIEYVVSFSSQFPDIQKSLVAGRLQRSKWKAVAKNATACRPELVPADASALQAKRHLVEWGRIT